MGEAKPIIWGIVPARGGSKGIPRKNVKLLGGKPLLQYTLEQAQASGVIDRLILSTDDGEIIALGQALGMEVPFLRPAELARDDTPMLAVLQHLVRTLMKNPAPQPDALVLLQPTLPFRKPAHIQQAVQILVERPDADSVISVSPLPHHFSPYYALKVEEEKLAYFIPQEQHPVRRQDMPPLYYRNGVIYAMRTRTLLEQNSLQGRAILPLIIEEPVINLDTPEDWQQAEAYLLRAEQLSI